MCSSGWVAQSVRGRCHTACVPGPTLRRGGAGGDTPAHASLPLLGIAAVSVGGGLPLWPENHEEYVIKNML